MTRPKSPQQAFELDSENRAFNAPKDRSFQLGRRTSRTYVQNVQRPVSPQPSDAGSIRTRTLSPPPQVPPQMQRLPPQPLQHLPSSLNAPMDLASVLQLPEHMRITFTENDITQDCRVDPRMEAMRIATKQAAIREEVANHMLGKATSLNANWSGSTRISFGTTGGSSRAGSIHYQRHGSTRSVSPPVTASRGRTLSPPRLGSAATQWQMQWESSSSPTRPGSTSPVPRPAGFLTAPWQPAAKAGVTPGSQYGAAKGGAFLPTQYGAAQEVVSPSVAQGTPDPAPDNPSFFEDVTVPAWAWGGTTTQAPSQAPAPGKPAVSASVRQASPSPAANSPLSRSIVVVPARPVQQVEMQASVSPRSATPRSASGLPRKETPSSWKTTRRTSSIAGSATHTPIGSASTTVTVPGAKSAWRKEGYAPASAACSIEAEAAAAEDMKQELEMLTKEIQMARKAVQRAQQDLTQKVEESRSRTGSVDPSPRLEPKAAPQVEGADSGAPAEPAPLELNGTGTGTAGEEQAVELPELSDPLGEALNEDTNTIIETNLLDSEIPWSRASSPVETEHEEATGVVTAQVVSNPQSPQGVVSSKDQDDKRKPLSLPSSVSASSTTTADPRRVPPRGAQASHTAPRRGQVGSASVASGSARSPGTPTGGSFTSSVSTQPGSGGNAKRTQRVPMQSQVAQRTAGSVRVSPSPPRRVPPVRQAESNFAPHHRQGSKSIKTPTGSPVLSNRTARLGSVQFSMTSVSTPSLKPVQSNSMTMRPAPGVTTAMRGMPPMQTASQAGKLEAPAGGTVQLRAVSPGAVRATSPAPAQAASGAMRAASPAPPQGGIVRGRAASPALMRSVSPALMRAPSPASPTHTMSVQAAQLSPRGYQVAASRPEGFQSQSAGALLMQSRMMPVKPSSGAVGFEVSPSSQKLPTWCMVPRTHEQSTSPSGTRVQANG